MSNTPALDQTASAPARSAGLGPCLSQRGPATLGSTLWRAVLACAALLLTSCQTVLEQPGETPKLSDRIVVESYALRSLFTTQSALFFPLVVLIAFGISRLLGVVVRVLWRLGLDPNRRLAAYRAFWDIGLSFLAVWAMLARLIGVAPILSLFGIALGLAALTVALREQLQDIAVGLSLVGRRRLREGDRVHIGEHAGTVRRIGLNRVELRRSDGTAVHVPTRLFETDALVVGHAKNTVPVTATLLLKDHHEGAVERARRTALVSPFRATGTPIDVSLQPEGTLRVEIQAWSNAAARDAAAQLEQALRRELSSDRRLSLDLERSS